MEKIFTNKRIWKKIVVAILIVMAFNMFFSVPIAKADNDDSAQDGDNLVDKGILMRPIMSLFVSIGDGILYLIHQSIMGSSPTLVTITVQKDLLQQILDWNDILIDVISILNPVAGLAKGFIHDNTAKVREALKITPVGETEMIDGYGTSTFNNADVPSKIDLPLYTYSPEEIFKGNIKLFSVDFFTTTSQPKEGKIVQTDNQGNTKEKTFYYYEDSNGEDIDTDGDGTSDIKGYKTSKDDSAYLLRDTVSRWYVALRNICIVIMLSVLIYIGIRMMLTSVANDKAKYKEMIKNWIVGMCLLFIMHYIMTFSVVLVQKFTDLISTSVDKNGYIFYLYSDDFANTNRGFTSEQKDTAIEALNNARSL